MKIGTLVRSVALATGFCGVLSAGQVNLGFIGVWAGLSSAPDYQLVVLSNQSALGPCNTASTSALSCDAVSLTSWSIEVDYTMLTGGLQVAQPTVFNSSSTCGVAGCDIIGSNNDYIASPLYALPYSVTNPGGSDTLVTRIKFSASLTGPISIWNPGDIAPSTFFPQSPFSVTIDIPPTDDYSLGNSPVYLTDFLISDVGPQAPPPDVPEPGSVTLVFAGVGALIVRHRLRRS